MRAARAYVPVIIRRPHAYDFLIERFSDRAGAGDEVSGSEAGIQVGALQLPIPGFYALDGEGKILGQCALGSVDELVVWLQAQAKR